MFGSIGWIYGLGRPQLDLDMQDVAGGFMTRFYQPDQEMSDLLQQANDQMAEAAVDDYILSRRHGFVTGLLARLHQADQARESKVSAQWSLQNHACICPFCRCGVEGLVWTFIPQIGSVDSFTYVAGSSSKC